MEKDDSPRCICTPLLWFLLLLPMQVTMKISGTPIINVTLDEMRSECREVEGRKDAFEWRERVLVVTRDEWGKRVALMDEQSNATVFQYGNVSSLFKAKEVIS